METLNEALQRMKSERASSGHGQPAYVEDWWKQVPPGSKWMPGLPGKPDCEICMGLGYVRADFPLGHPMMGKLFLCECARSGITTRRVNAWTSACGLSLDELGKRWSKVSVSNPEIRDAVTSIRGKLSSGRGWCYVYGTPGQGKTTMLKTAVAETINAGREALYITHADLLEYLRAGYDSGEYDSRVEYLRLLPVLAIDEFQRTRPTEWEAEADSRVLDVRHNRAGQSVTLFASNFPAAQYSEWFASRLAQFERGVLALTVGDMRRAK